MRIRHVVRGRLNTGNADGIIHYVHRLASTQLEMGHDVEVIGVAASSAHPESLWREGVHVHAFPRTMNPFAVHPGLTDYIEMLASEAKPVCWHVHNCNDPASRGAAIEASRYGFPFVISAHGMWSPIGLARHRVKKIIYRYTFDRSFTRRAAALHAVSATEVGDLADYAPGCPIVLIENGVDVATLREVVRDDHYWENWFGELAEESKTFVYLGRLDPYQKGLDVLIEALAKWSASSSGGRHRVALVGPSWRGGADLLRAMIRKHEIGERVRIIAPLFGDEKYKALASADCFIYPSRYDVSPQAVLEAMSCGLPAILTPGTSMMHKALDANACFDARLDPDSLADALARASSTPISELRRMGSSARDLVASKHDLRSSARRLADFYALVCLRSGRANETWLPASTINQTRDCGSDVDLERTAWRAPARRGSWKLRRITRGVTRVVCEDDTAPDHGRTRSDPEPRRWPSQCPQ